MTPEYISSTALALLVAHANGEATLTRKAAGFAGELVVEPGPLSEKQRNWFEILVERHGMPAAVTNGGAHD